MPIAGNTMPSFHLAHEQVLSIEPENRDGGLKMTCKTIAYYSPIHYPAFIGGQGTPRTGIR